MVVTNEFLTQIPNVEKGKLHIVNACDQHSVASVVKELTSRLRAGYNTSVCCVSMNDCLHGMDADDEQLLVASFHYVTKKNPDCNVVIRTLQGMYNRHFVRAFIVEGTEQLKLYGKDGKLRSDPEGVEWQLTAFARHNNVPVIVVRMTSD